jgi:nicotinate phosphoribosyltransferase
MAQSSHSSQSTSAALFVDLYELAMVDSYVREGKHATAVFELYFRELPETRNFAIAAGLQPLLETLENLAFGDQDLEYLRGTKRFSNDMLAYLRGFRFRGDIDALPEGTAVFPYEPLLRVTAPLPEAQLIETLALNQIHFATLAASKAARVVLAADGRDVVEFGARRAHGTDAALAVARAAYLVGFAGTSLVEAGRRFGIPLFGTMAHSFIQAHANEATAFRKFVECFPQTTLLVDTYDTLRGVQRVIELQKELGERFQVQAIRLDSGDLADLARQSRKLLDDAGLTQVRIFASGGLDEYKLAEFAAAGAPIDAYGVGTALAVSADAPSVDLAYKLVEYEGTPRVKLSSHKESYPGAKQVFRHRRDGRFTHDTLEPVNADAPGEPLLVPVMRGGKRLPAGRVGLEESRRHAASQLDTLPEHLRSLSPAKPAYPVTIAESLVRELNALRAKVAR